MEEEEDDSNSSIDNPFHGFTDASDSFESDNHTPSHSLSNITDTFLHSNSKTSNDNNNHKSKHSTRYRSSPVNSPFTSDSDSSFLFSFSGLVIKIILNLFTVPVWLTYYSYMFLIHPAKLFMLDKLSTIFGCVKSIIHILITKNESTWKLCFQIGWGLLWSVYVVFILTCLLVFAFLIGGVIMKCILVKPIEITEQLSFDYTKYSPVAFVPLMSCPDPSFLDCSGTRVIPLDHKVSTIVSLTLPESYYNRNLGVFQVRVEFLSGNGQRLASSSQPCMLHYKSLPIRLMLTFLKIAPVVMGYSSESQKLHIKFKEYTERKEPTSCLRVILEQRAEFTRGAGIPEIYEASLKLESRQPLFKRILWHWKWTIYIWVSIMMFVIELFFTLLCCTPVIFPWIQPRGVSVNNSEPMHVKNSLLAMAEPVVE